MASWIQSQTRLSRKRWVRAGIRDGENNEPAVPWCVLGPPGDKVTRPPPPPPCRAAHCLLHPINHPQLLLCHPVRPPSTTSCDIQRQQNYISCTILYADVTTKMSKMVYKNQISKNNTILNLAKQSQKFNLNQRVTTQSSNTGVKQCW